MSRLPSITAASHSFHSAPFRGQTFDNMNKALKLSCTKGLPVRVVRSFKASCLGGMGWAGVGLVGTLVRLLSCWSCQPASVHSASPGALPTPCINPVPWPIHLQEKRSSYAPTEDTPVRYDGIYRIARCWRTKGKQVRMHRQLRVSL